MKVSRSIVWNVCGTTFPLVVGIAVIPAIIRHLGVARFGVLSVVWMMMGYFSVFDLGLSRTLTKVTADRVGTSAEHEIPSLVTTTLVLVVTCSVILAVLVAATSRVIAERILSVPTDMIADVSHAIAWLAIGLPFVLIATVLFGVLEGLHRFATTSLVRLPLGVLMFLVPLGVVPFTVHLGPITAALTGLRVAVAGVLAWITVRTLPGIRAPKTWFKRDQVKPLITYGGWLTVSNFVGPLLVYFDRFVIAAVLGAAAIAYYTVPFDTVNRLLILPTAMQAVLFPAFATLRTHSPARVIAVFEKSAEKTLLAMFPALLGVMLLANPALNLWVGPVFANQSSTVARALMIGIFVNSLARAPLVLVQGYGHSKWTGLLTLAELPLYGSLLWMLLKWYGINGAAYAWTARVLVDTAILYFMAGRCERGLIPVAIRNAVWMSVACAGAIVLNATTHGTPVRVVLVALAALSCGAFILQDVRKAVLARGGSAA